VPQPFVVKGLNPATGRVVQLSIVAETQAEAAGLLGVMVSSKTCPATSPLAGQPPDAK
jgi:hypothetical protein